MDFTCHALCVKECCKAKVAQRHTEGMGTEAVKRVHLMQPCICRSTGLQVCPCAVHMLPS